MKTIVRLLIACSGLAILSTACEDESTTSQDASLPDGSSGNADASPIDSGAPRLDANVDPAPVDAAPIDAAPADAAGPVQVASLSFDDMVPRNVTAGTGTLTPSQGFANLGTEGNKFGTHFLRSPTGNTVEIVFSDLPPHTSISVGFLFAAIDSLDGEGAFPAGDYFRVDLDGKTVFRETFANALMSQIQTYMPPPGVVLARHVDLGFSGPGSFYTDSAYDMSVDPTFANLPHTANKATFTFTLEGAGVQDINDESWAIDNVRVATGFSPRDRSADAGAQ